ncbi:MAG: hypothetical protein WD294_00745 [Phycisphaeraceae bacterium]
MSDPAPTQPFTFRSGSWSGKAAALAMVLAFGSAVTLYWELQRTAVGLVGITLLVAMALACAIWWRVRVDPGTRSVTRSAMLVGLVPLAWRKMQGDQIATVRFEGKRRARAWHDYWYIYIIGTDGRSMTVDWASVVRTDEPTEAWQHAQKIARALGVPVENKGIIYG